jgi:hypothetical protein
VDGQKNPIPARNEWVGRFYEKRHVFFRYIHCFNPSVDTAEEIFQEACLKFLTISSFSPDCKAIAEPQSKPRTWIAEGIDFLTGKLLLLRHYRVIRNAGCKYHCAII